MLARPVEISLAHAREELRLLALEAVGRALLRALLPGEPLMMRTGRFG